MNRIYFRIFHPKNIPRLWGARKSFALQISYLSGSCNNMAININLIKIKSTVHDRPLIIQIPDSIRHHRLVLFLSIGKSFSSLGLRLILVELETRKINLIPSEASIYSGNIQPSVRRSTTSSLLHPYSVSLPPSYRPSFK